VRTIVGAYLNILSRAFGLSNKNEMKKNLIDYCAVDTSVMIDIWKAILSYN